MKTLYMLVLVAMFSMNSVEFLAQKAAEKTKAQSTQTRSVSSSRSGGTKRVSSAQANGMQARPSSAPSRIQAERAGYKPPTENPAVKPTVQEPGELATNEKKAAVQTENDFNYKEVFQRNTYYHRRQLKKQRRHCGCGGDIVLVNTTSDTLDIYLGYLSQEQVPTIENAVLPYLTNVRMYPSFYIVPHGEAKIRGGCNGGIQYEALVHKQKGVPMSAEEKKLHIQGSIRTNCKPKRMVYLEAPLQTN